MDEQLTKSFDIPEAVSLTDDSLVYAKDQYKLMRQYVGSFLVEGEDYGVIPGGSQKKVLHKSGAEKLCKLFKLRPSFRDLEVINDFQNNLFFYRYACDLYHFPTGLLIGTAIGSCNSKEKKYRYRESRRKCPACNKETIIKGREEFGGGWLCFAKKGGCGAKFKDSDEVITSQEVGIIENPDIADQVNTLDKMAQKRALVAATLIAVAGSDLFTQDIGDDEIVDERTGEILPKQVASPPVPAPEKDPEDLPQDDIGSMVKRNIEDLETVVRKISSITFEDPNVILSDTLGVGDLTFEDLYRAKPSEARLKKLNKALASAWSKHAFLQSQQGPGEKSEVSNG